MKIRPFLYSLWPLVLALLLLSVPSAVAYAQSPEPPTNGQEELTYDEAEAHAINQMIMCPVCPAETIDQAQVPIARQMRQIVREMLAEGATREEILDFFAQRYGPGILAAPPKSGFNLIAWVFPIAGVAAALIAGGLVIRSMSARKSDGTDTEPAAPPSSSDLKEYLEIVDQELALGQHSQDDSVEAASAGVEPRREEGSHYDG